jgi:hypothetical protein
MRRRTGEARTLEEARRETLEELERMAAKDRAKRGALHGAGVPFFVIGHDADLFTWTVQRTHGPIPGAPWFASEKSARRALEKIGADVWFLASPEWFGDYCDESDVPAGALEVRYLLGLPIPQQARKRTGSARIVT